MTASVLSAAELVACLKQRRLGPFIGVPCSLLKPLIDYLTRHEPGAYLAVNNEGEAVAVAAGAYLAGQRPVVMFQNSGLGNAVNPLTSLCHPFGIPVLIIVTLRGDPQGRDEPQHHLMGRITERLLDLMEIPHDRFPTRPEELEACFDTVLRHLDTRRTPYALVVRELAVTPCGDSDAVRSVEHPFALRRDAILAIVAAAGDDALLVATTGKTARELYEVRDRNENLYVVGSMGCASSIALGIALFRADRHVVVLDGDGAALMRLEALATIGHYAPHNLTHVVLDNQAYESTGGQETLSPTVEFPLIARACGYRTASSFADPRDVTRLFASARQSTGPHFIHFRVRTGSVPTLGRPQIDPADVALRFRRAAASFTEPAEGATQAS